MTITLDIESTITKLTSLHKDAEFWFRSAELDVVDGSYFPTNPTKPKTPDSIRLHNRKVKQGNFISAKKRLTNIKNEYLNILKSIIFHIELEERKRLMSIRYDIEKMIKDCEHYIEIFS